MITDQMAAETLQLKWRDELCPLVNGLVCENGAIELLEVDRSDRNTITVENLGATSLAEFLSGDPDAFSALTQFCALDLPTHQLRLSAGGGSGGGDGYVAASDLATNHLKWILCFDDSNEFEKLGLQGDTILAETNLRETWEICLSNPRNITVHPSVD